MDFPLNISWNRCKIRAFWPQLPIVWHQARQIWLKLKSRLFIKRFTSRSNEIRGCEDTCNISELLLFRCLWLVKKLVYIFKNQWQMTSHNTYEAPFSCRLQVPAPPFTQSADKNTPTMSAYVCHVCQFLVGRWKNAPIKRWHM